MSSESLRFVFANAVSAIIFRLDSVAELKSNKRDFCRAIAIGFELTEYAGDDVFTHALETNTTDIVGFGTGSAYSFAEDVVKGTIDGDSVTSSLTDTQRRAFAVAVNAILFGYSANPNITIAELKTTIGATLVEVGDRVVGIQPYRTETINGVRIVYHPFSVTVIRSILSQTNYDSVLPHVNESPRNVEVDLVHYNYYDTEPVFSGPDLDKMKDAENQYYYISGSLLYPEMPTGLSFCEEEEVTINAVGGPKTITILNNHPCIDEDTFTAPLTGNKFYREFNDGPYSSGDFTSDVKNTYIKWDKTRLSGIDYSGNSTKLYSFNLIGNTTGYHHIYLGGVQKDAEGLYNLNHEYSKAPMDTGCLATFQVMRVGDARKRSQCIKYDINGNCEQCQEIDVTGFKYANISLEEDLWADKFAYVLTNPPTKDARIMVRALNMVANPYIGEVSGGQLITATKDINGKYNWYIGPPQIGSDQLPYFAFENSFANNTFGKNASVVLWPAIGSSAGGSFGESARSFSVSSRPILTGTDLAHYTVESLENGSYPRAQFFETISAYTSGDDDIKTKVFGMGNAFSGRYSVNTSVEENAGYHYSGYNFIDSQNATYSEIEVANAWSAYKIGSPYNTVKYISGYSGKTNLEINRMISQDLSGNSIEYYYFDNRLLPNGIEIKQTGWDSFAPLPTDIESDSSYKRAYNEIKVENNYQKYYRGPYATYLKKFLYPNAKTIEALYDENLGYPIKFKYKVRVREETVKELYVKYKISNGWSYSTPDFIPVVRTAKSNLGATKQVMAKMFSAGGTKYDFNHWDIDDGFFYTSGLPHAVDNHYAPVMDSYVVFPNTFPLYDSGKNATTYINPPTFSQGILITGNTYQEHKRYTKTAKSDGVFWYSPASMGVGLYHGYSGYEATGELTYTYPLFRMEQGRIDKSSATGALPLTASGCISYFHVNTPNPPTLSKSMGISNLYTKQLDGRIFYSSSGQDPIFFKEIGGRTGSNTATGQGGYHPNGLIGDSWMSIWAEHFGCWCSTWTDVCDDGDYSGQQQLNFSVNASTNDNRVPSEDKRWLYFNITPNKTTIYTRALDFNPMAYNRTNIPYNRFSTAPTSSKSTTFTYQEGNNSFRFDLSQLFPFKYLSNNNEWYINPSGSGVRVGPFDRDVEIFVNSGAKITGYNSLYINRRKISDFASGSDSNCSAPRILEGETLLDMSNINPIIYIPSGESAILNVKGIETGGYVHNGSAPPVSYGSAPHSYYGSTPPSLIGFPSKSYLHIRARYALNEREYSEDTQSALGISGNNYWLHNKNFIKNGSEREYAFDTPNNNPLSLEGTKKTFTTFSRSGKFYPLPDMAELTSYRTEDANGNGSYSIDDLEEFYNIKTAKDRSTVYVTGWREGSRVSFEFVEIIPVYDAPPYESHMIVIPSGNAIVSGEMGYLGQSDASVFTEGFSLEDVTPNDLIRDNIYGPQYVSDVLNRIPFYEFPTGNYKNPVLEAPSMMKQRTETFVIESEQEYSGINNNAPENYNKLLWPALSDLRTLNPDETLEEIPPSDGNTFTNSTMLISAAQGQLLPNGNRNPNTRKIYAVRDQYQMYDSVATDALINSGYFLTQKRGTVTQLTQPESGYTVPKGTTLTEIKNELI
jgi:hypothetical protein